MAKNTKYVAEVDNTVTEEKGGTEIAKTWLTGHDSVTMIIEKKIAEEYGLTDPQYVVLERKKEGILIRKLNL